MHQVPQLLQINGWRMRTNLREKFLQVFLHVEWREGWRQKTLAVKQHTVRSENRLLPVLVDNLDLRLARRCHLLLHHAESQVAALAISYNSANLHTCVRLPLSILQYGPTDGHSPLRDSLGPDARAGYYPYSCICKNACQ